MSEPAPAEERCAYYYDSTLEGLGIQCGGTVSKRVNGHPFCDAHPYPETTAPAASDSALGDFPADSSTVTPGPRSSLRSRRR